jgi:hypothetical protein
MLSNQCGVDDVCDDCARADSDRVVYHCDVRAQGLHPLDVDDHTSAAGRPFARTHQQIRASREQPGVRTVSGQQLQQLIERFGPEIFERLHREDRRCIA